LAALQLVHVDLETGRIRVVNGKGGKHHELPIIPRLGAMLQEYLEQVRPQLAGEPVGSLRRGRRRNGRSWRLVQYANGRGAPQTQCHFSPFPSSS
jgi:integrase